MKLSVTRVDIEKTRQRWPADTPFAPAHVFLRVDKHNWYVLAESLLPDAPPKWYQTAADEFIRIPLFSYLLSPEADLAFAFMLQLGLSCAAHFPGAVTALHVVTGIPVEMAYDSNNTELKHLEYWVGLGVVVQGG
jgi:hypothetical protein